MAATTYQHGRRTSVVSPEKILIATDLNDLAWLAPHAIAQARSANASILLVHAVSALFAASMGGAEIPVASPAQLIEDARLALLPTVQAIEAAGIPCSAEVNIGTAAEVVGAAVRNVQGGARIIMGTHGRGKLRQLALGSVAHDLIAEATVPIFVVGPHAQALDRNLTPRHLLHPVSFSGNYEAAARQVFALARASYAHVTLLHVLDERLHDAVNPERMTQWAHNALGQLSATADLPPEHLHLQVVAGGVAEQVVRIARQAAANWIVFAADEQTSASVLNESRAFRVMAEADCPVMVIRS